MKNYILLLLTICFFATACEEDEPTTPDYYNATVLKQGTDCGEAFLIQFESGQIGLPENDFDRTFYEINLDTMLRKDGQKLKIKFRDPTDGEHMICTTMGPGFPQIFVLDAFAQ